MTLLADLLDLIDSATLLDDDGSPDPDLIRSAADTLIVAKPHLGNRPRGDIDQGAKGTTGASVDLAARLRHLAGWLLLGVSRSVAAVLR